MAETIDRPTAGQADPQTTALHLGNFKAFGGAQRAPLRPLTIVFGPNSSGKSSIIHSLLFGHEALTSKRPNWSTTDEPGHVAGGGAMSRDHRRRLSEYIGDECQ